MLPIAAESARSRMAFRGEPGARSRRSAEAPPTLERWRVDFAAASLQTVPIAEPFATCMAVGANRTR